MTTTTATKKFALAALAAPVLAALAIGIAGAAHADSSTAAGDQISSLQAAGTHVVVTKDAATAPLDQCAVLVGVVQADRDHRALIQRGGGGVLGDHDVSARGL